MRRALLLFVFTLRPNKSLRKLDMVAKPSGSFLPPRPFLPPLCMFKHTVKLTRKLGGAKITAISG